MASLTEEELCCPVCHYIYTDPVLLSCNHSFCRACVENWWKTSETKHCPLCKKRISKNPPPDMDMRNKCEAFLQLEASACDCGLHREELTLFCVQHLQPLCVVCGHSSMHSGHTVRSIEEAAPGFKEQLQQTLQPLKIKIQDLIRSKKQFSAAAAHVEAQARLIEKQIQDQFKNLHQFLEEEEQARLRALREEEQQKRMSLEDKMAAVSREMEALAETIAATEKQMEAADVSFLLQYKAVVERLQRCPLVEVPQMGPGALIDQAKHLGNLGFNVWRNMKDLVQFYPVVLDPNTAYADLTLSENLSCMRSGKTHTLPENPERFQSFCVLGSEGYSSGTHSWEVEVSRDDLWTVGVIQKSVQRKGRTQTRMWVIYHCNGKYFAFLSPDLLKPLSVKNLERVRVKLDFDKGTLLFSEPYTNSLLHTFRYPFSERLYPYFQNYNQVPLKIVPGSASITMK